MGVDDYLTLLTLLSGFFFGACLGSFASAVIWRIPRHKPWVYDLKLDGRFNEFVRSRCPSCGHTLETLDLIPVLSWLFQSGKCRHCKKPIGIIYPLLEIIAGIAGTILFISLGVSISTTIIAFFITFLFIFIWIGVHHSMWSKQILLILIFLTLVFIVFTGF